MDREQLRLSILQYYIGGKPYNQEHDKDTIKQLKNQGYLRCGITSEILETMKTTDKGMIYLKLSGVNVEAPVIVGGRIHETIKGATL